MSDDIDPRTGFPWGDHGTGSQAIQWILHECDDVDAYCTVEFLHDWECGDLTDWPEYYIWLKGQKNG